MAINCNMLTEYLPEILLKKADHKYHMPISYVTVYQEGLDIRYHTIYILDSPKQFYEIEAMQPSSFLIRGKLTEGDLRKTPHEVICVSASVTVSELYRIVSEVLKKYKDWEDALKKILMAGGTITEMCQVSVPYFENTMVVQNKDFELLGVGETTEISYPYAYREGESEYLALDIVLQGVPDAEVIFKRKEPFFYNDYVPGYPSLLYNIFCDGRYAAQICVDAVNRKFVEADLSKVVILGKYIRTGLMYVRENTRKRRSSLENVFLEYLLEPSANRGRMLISMERTEWNRKDEYVICLLDVTDTNRRNIGSSYICDFISYQMAASISVHRKNRIYVLLNISRSEKSLMVKKMRKLQKTFGFTAGISDSFFDIMDAPLFVKQARIAIQTGSTLGGSNFHLFTDYRLPYVLEAGMDALTKKVLIPSQLWRMMKESNKTSDVLLETLTAFLQCNCNVNETSEQLAVNRNTLKNRLKRLREMLQTDFRNQDEILYYKMILEVYTF